MLQAHGLVVFSFVLLGISVPTKYIFAQSSQTKQSLSQLPSALYLSDFKNKNDAMSTWERYKSHVPILYLFQPFTINAPSSGNVSLIAMINKVDIPPRAANQILLDTCEAIQQNGHACSQFQLNMGTFEKRPTQSIDLNASQHGNSRTSDLTSLNLAIPRQSTQSNTNQRALSKEEVPLSTEDNINNNEFKDSTISKAAMKAAYDLVKNRYESAIYRAQIDGADSIDMQINDGLALTKDALSTAAERAFEKFLQENYRNNNFEGQSYDGLRGYFIKSFKQAATTSIKSVGKSFVRDLTSDGGFRSLSIRSEILSDIDENLATALIDTGLTAAKNSQYAFLRNLEVSYKIREGLKPEYSVLTLQPLGSWRENKHNVFAQAAISREGKRNNVSAGLAYRYMPPSEEYVVGANAFLDYQHPFGHQRASVGLDYQTSLWGASTNYYKGLTKWRDSNTGFEERSLDGQDIELIGRMPFLPALQVSGRAYRWQSFEQDDIKGQEVQVEYSPVPAFTIEALINDENGRNTEFGMGVRYNYVFGAPDEYLYDWNEQFRQKSASEYIFKKVRRDNKIRVEERIDAEYANANLVAPGLLATSPVNGATGQSVGVNVSFTFDQDVQAGAGNIVFTDLTDGSDDFTIPVGDARVSIVNDTVTIDLSAQLLDFSTNYEVTFASGVFQDLSGNSAASLNVGDLNFQTVVDPTAGFPAVTVSMAPGTTSGSHENAQDPGTWRTIIDVGAAPDGVIFESGATGQGIAASFSGVNLVFGAGDGSSAATNGDTIFGTYPIASIPQGRHHFVFVADPDAAAEIGVYIDGIRVITETIVGGMQGGEWAGTNGAGYGLVNSAIRVGVDTSNISGATLISNLNFFTNTVPADF